MSSMIVETKYGKLQGVKEDGCIVFKGVPYAMPPVGDLRFKAPRPPMPWDGVLKADAFSCRSAQNDINTPDTFYGKEFYQEKGICHTSVGGQPVFESLGAGRRFGRGGRGETFLSGGSLYPWRCIFRRVRP